jgi:D-alanyl-D-alanine carboxypeptidase (penicillin-binding protein 5/6)
MRFSRLIFPILAVFLFGTQPSEAAHKRHRRSPARKHSPSSRTAAPSAKTQIKPQVTDDPDDLVLAARGAIVLDALSGKPLYEKNADTRFYPASTTKIMTSLLVIEAGNLDEFVEVTVEDSKVGESSLNIRPGDRFTRRQMLYGLMLKSANDVAHALGRDNAGSIEAFAQKMTARARELGCVNTQFANPHGLHNPAHYTTPRDLATITRAAMNQPLFRQIVSTKTARWETTAGGSLLTNHNRLLDKFAGCNGVKTGYTIPAQQVLASSAARDGKEAIAVVMHTDKPGIWEDSAKLLEFALRKCGAPPVAKDSGR